MGKTKISSSINIFRRRIPLRKSFICLREQKSRQFADLNMDNHTAYDTRRYQKRLNCMMPCEYYFAIAA